MKRFSLILTLSFIMIFIGTSNAYAYLDMGTGSYILQILLASLAASALFIKVFWVRLKSFFIKSKPSIDRDESSNE